MSKKVFYSFVAILIGYIFISGNTYFRSQQPIVRAEKKVYEKAKSEIDINGVEEFYMFTKDKTYYSIVSTNKEGRLVYCSYDPKTDYFKSGYGDEMVNETDALAITRYNLPEAEVKEARLGVDEEQFVWEVSFYAEDGSLGYHYIDATTGQWYETINNL